MKPKKQTTQKKVINWKQIYDKNHPGKLIYITFHHQTKDLTPIKRPYRNSRRRYTLCHLCIQEKEHHFKTGIAIVNPLDKNYRKQTGRSIAYRRAHKNPLFSNINKDEKNDLFTAFRNYQHQTNERIYDENLIKTLKFLR